MNVGGVLELYYVQELLEYDKWDDELYEGLVKGGDVLYYSDDFIYGGCFGDYCLLDCCWDCGWVCNLCDFVMDWEGDNICYWKFWFGFW